MTNDLKTNISTFAKQFGCVSTPQIRFMFRTSSQEAVDWFIRSLLFERVFMRKDEKSGMEYNHKGDFSEENIENQLIYARKNFTVSNAHIQQLIMQTAWVVGIFGPENIVHMVTSQFPSQLFFCTADGKAYDVTVVAPMALMPTIQAAKKEFRLTTLSGGEDCITHIAVIYNEADADKVNSEHVFDYYVIVKPDMKEAELKEFA